MVYKIPQSLSPSLIASNLFSYYLPLCSLVLPHQPPCCFGMYWAHFLLRAFVLALLSAGRCFLLIFASLTPSSISSLCPVTTLPLKQSLTSLFKIPFPCLYSQSCTNVSYHSTYHVLMYRIISIMFAVYCLLPCNKMFHQRRCFCLLCSLIYPKCLKYFELINNLLFLLIIIPFYLPLMLYFLKNFLFFN